MMIRTSLSEDPLEWPTDAGLTKQQYRIVRVAAGQALQAFHEDSAVGVWDAVSDLDEEQKLVLWAILRPHPALRSCIKRLAKENASHGQQIDGPELGTVADPGSLRQTT